MTVAPNLEIAGKRAARVGKAHCFLQDVHVGREFAVGGRLYQSITTPTVFSRVPVGSRFRRDGKWYKRMSDSDSRLLDPNMPFADPCGVSVNMGVQMKVDMLEWTLRGDDPHAAPAPAPDAQNAARA